jgi:hypothetical protein
MFMFGMLCRLHPLSTVFQASRAGLRLTWIALAVALAFAAYKLLIESQPEPGYLKQHLSSLRVVSFISIAWLVAQLSRLGWIDRLATALPPVVTVGRQGLTCFVWGTLISIVADTALQVAAPAFHTRTQAVAAALSVDSLTIAAVLAIAIAIATTTLKASRPIPRRQHRTGQYGRRTTAPQQERSMVSSRCWQVEGDAATISGMKRTTLPQRAPATGTISHAGYRFPPDVISYAVWLYYHFPLSLRMVEELLAARGIELTYETVRHWAVKFGLGIARRIRSTALARGDKWHPDEGAVLKMGVGLPESACRSRLQTARCCCVQKAWW